MSRVRSIVAVALLGLTSVAHAHDREGCPPAPMLSTMSKKGALSEQMRACAAEKAKADTEEGRAHAWILWRDRRIREGATDEVAAEAHRLLAATTSPDQALEAAELLVDGQPEGAREALQVTLRTADRWHLVGLRAASLARAASVAAALDPEQGAIVRAQALRALGIVGPQLAEAVAACEAIADADTCAKAHALEATPAAAPVPDHLVPCANPGHLWLRARWGSVYTTERDCMAHAAAGLPAGETRATGARLAALLAVRHKDRAEASALLRALAPFLPGDAGLAAEGWAVHVEHDDDIGASWWADWLR